jgi:hypothetical protein
MNRLGRGYSFEALRAKALFTEGIHSHKQKRPRFECKRVPELVNEKREMGYGVDISTLVCMIEAGEI